MQHRIIRINGESNENLSFGTFRIFNNKAFLKDDGEFTWGWLATRRLYVKVANGNSLKIVALPTLKNLIEIRDASNVTLMRLKFQNVPWDGRAVRLIGGGKHKLGANVFQYVGTGLYMEKSSDNLIGGNTFESLGTHGIEMPVSHRNKIYANSMRGMGTVNKHSSRIFGYGISNNQIAFNDFNGGSRYGVAIKDWDTSGKGTTINKNNVIEYNWAYNMAQETSDGAGLEMLGRTQTLTGSIIRHNIVSRYNGLQGTAGKWRFGEKGFGVYMDDSESGVTITQNLVQNIGIIDDEKNSIIAGPQFVDRANGNYALKSTSPAITKLGFKQPDFAKIGRSKYTSSSALPAF